MLRRAPAPFRPWPSSTSDRRGAPLRRRSMELQAQPEGPTVKPLANLTRACPISREEAQQCPYAHARLSRQFGKLQTRKPGLYARLGPRLVNIHRPFILINTVVRGRQGGCAGLCLCQLPNVGGLIAGSCWPSSIIHARQLGSGPCRFGFQFVQQVPQLPLQHNPCEIVP